MSTRANIIADSVSPVGIRLTTFLVRFPRFILAEFNTHRVFSRNSASSRAIPTEKIIEAVNEEPFIPDKFNARVKGMGIGKELSPAAQDAARLAWINARDAAVRQVMILLELNVDKSRANRLLEPFMWHDCIVTSTEWDNFFKLRTASSAQPEFRHLARLMEILLKTSSPNPLDEGEWHLPLLEPDEISSEAHTLHEKKYLSARRCARISYNRHLDEESIDVSLMRAKELEIMEHMSPFEHQARPATFGDGSFLGDARYEFHKNFRGWVQFRHQVEEKHVV
jgi:thymidylate synthase ThyX